MGTKHPRLPDYQNPDTRSIIGKWNDSIYLRTLDEFQAMLSKYSLQDALKLLHEQQTDAGFIIDDLSAVRNFQCHCPQGIMFFIGQYNPTRMRRFQGIGRNIPPAGVATTTTRSLKCFICADNISWQYKGVQLYYRFTVNGNSFAALCNPFPFMPTHITIAAAEHRPQSWHSNAQEEARNIQRIVEDIYGISTQLPGWVCFYNGVGAGASIEEHFHYQAFKTPDGHGLFPLQHAAKQIEQKANEAISMPASEAAASVLIVDSSHYPLTAFRISGSRDHMIGAAIERIREWSNTIGNAASANLIAVHEKGQVVFYLIPRNERYSRSIGLTGTVGGLEVMGEILLCTPEENEAINKGLITYSYMWDILRGVNPPNVQRMTTR